VEYLTNIKIKAILHLDEESISLIKKRIEALKDIYQDAIDKELDKGTIKNILELINLNEELIKTK